MEAGFKTEGFACFVSETSRNLYGKEQRLPKALQELLVSWWGCTQHIPQLGQGLNSNVLLVSQGLLLLGQPFPCLGAACLRWE